LSFKQQINPHNPGFGQKIQAWIFAMTLPKIRSADFIEFSASLRLIKSG